MTGTFGEKCAQSLPFCNFFLSRGQVGFKNLTQYLGVVCQSTYYSLRNINMVPNQRYQLCMMAFLFALIRSDEPANNSIFTNEIFTKLSLCYKSPKFKFSVSGKKNVRLFGVMTKSSVFSDKNVPLTTAFSRNFHYVTSYSIYLIRGIYYVR